MKKPPQLPQGTDSDMDLCVESLNRFLRNQQSYVERQRIDPKKWRLVIMAAADMYFTLHASDDDDK